MKTACPEKGEPFLPINNVNFCQKRNIFYKMEGERHS